MSTTNFITMKDFDLWAIDDDKVVESFYYDDDIDDICDDDIYLSYRFMNNQFENDLLPYINKKLQWFNVSLKSGYYSGAQLFVDTDYVPIDDTWTNEDVWDNFHGIETVSDLLGLIDQEKALIRDFMENVASTYGFRKLLCLGVFNNGEGIYEWA